MYGKLFVIGIVNGNARIYSEWTNNEEGARVAYHNLCMSMWNAPDVENASIRLTNDMFDIYAQEFIHKELSPESNNESEGE